jgi:hypothetical protein
MRRILGSHSAKTKLLDDPPDLLLSGVGKLQPPAISISLEAFFVRDLYLNLCHLVRLRGRL